MVINDLESFTFIFVIYAFLTAIFNSHNSYLYAKKSEYTHVKYQYFYADQEEQYSEVQSCKKNF